MSYTNQSLGSEFAGLASYKSLFNSRAKAYKKAMDASNARASEFLHAIDFAELTAHCSVIDFPAGNGQLKQYLSKSQKYIPLELCADWGAPMACSEQAEYLFCIAAAHHLPELASTASLLLKPNGLLIIADVYEGSKEAEFLLNNVPGHSNFVVGKPIVGFKLEKYEHRSTPWLGNGMREFCAGIFGIDAYDKLNTLGDEVVYWSLAYAAYRKA